ncbi:MAG: DUF3617 family protein [Casimicrobiaceae bacterium]
MSRVLSPSFLLAATVAAALALPALAQDLPKRKSGLWEMTMGQGRTVSQCVDQAKDDAFRQMGQQLERENKCSRTNVQRAAGSLAFDSSCDFGNMKMVSKTLITGDFNTAYKMEMHTRYDPPLMGKAEGTTIIEAKWLGACKAGQRPGDMMMPGGMTMNVYDMLDAKKK